MEPGITLTPLAQSASPTCQWDTHAPFYCPRGFVRSVDELSLWEGDRRVLSQIEAVTRWPDGTPRWVHVFARFKWLNGMPVAYTLHKGRGQVAAKPWDDGAPPLPELELVDGQGVAWRPSPKIGSAGTTTLEQDGVYQRTTLWRGELRADVQRDKTFAQYAIWAVQNAGSRLVKYDVAVTFQQDMRTHSMRSLAVRFAGVPGVQVLTRHFDKKYPKDVQANGGQATIFLWPNKPHKPAEPITIQNVYQAPWIQRGGLFRTALPPEAFQVLSQQQDTTECKAVYAQGSDFKNCALRAQFALYVPKAGEKINVAAFQKLYETNPIAMPGKWLVEQGALGAIGPIGRGYAEIEDAIKTSYLGKFRCRERYQFYGQWNYGRIVADEICPEERPTLHRVSAFHYQEGSVGWLLFARSADADYLEPIRTLTDIYAEISPDSYMPHCKTFYPWCVRDPAMDGGSPLDDDRGLCGHWTDPTAWLYAWLIDANRYCHAKYEQWWKTWNFPKGLGREVNTTMFHICLAWQYRPDAKLLARVVDLARGLMSAPLDDPSQSRAGALWRPDWLNAVREVFVEAQVDTAEVDKFVLDNTKIVGLKAGDMWTMALNALAWQLDHDQGRLTRFAGAMEINKRSLYHRPGSKWDGHGNAVGPDHDGHFILQWPYLRKHLRDEMKLPGPNEPGNYLFGSSRYDDAPDRDARGLTVYVLGDGQPFDLVLEGLTCMGGDVEATSLVVIGPDNNRVSLEAPDGQYIDAVERLALSKVPRGGMGIIRASGWPATREIYRVPRGQPGIYQVRMSANSLALFQPLNSRGLPECQLVRNTKLTNWKEKATYAAKLTRGYLWPLVSRPLTLHCEAGGRADPTSFECRDASGHVIARHDLLNAPGEKRRAEVRLVHDAKASPAPWLLDIFSYHSGWFSCWFDAPYGMDEIALFGINQQHVFAVAKALRKNGTH